MAGTLHLVGTPIGNLGDVTRRAKETLARVDLVAAEDTRRARKLLSHLGIRAELTTLFEGNERARTETLLDVLRSGRDVAVISDAGMPGLSDPGYRLVRGCADEGIEVRVVPGPSAAIAALVVSGLPSDRFVFEGFLPKKEGERRARLEALATERRTIVVFESPRRVGATLEAVASALGPDRAVAVARELTKVHEEVLRGTAKELARTAGGEEVRGEVVLVIGGATQGPAPEVSELVEEATELIRGGWRKREAAAEVARRHDASTNTIYRALLQER
ncbi:MAG: 16S rRNA (cytidine(1402)-2'-O)-methyltransferase [Actinomycetota bacterium]